MTGSNLYFKGRNFFGRLLRFCNLIEPGADLVLSMSKIMLWISIALFVWVVLNKGDVTSLAGAVTVLGGAIGNYGYRRRLMYKNGHDPYEQEKCDEPRRDDVH